MKTLRAKNLQLAGIELVLPTVLCIDGHQAKGTRTTLTVGYATGYVDTIVAPLVAEWLARHFHRRFTEHGRGAEGDLAAEAFYDKLACHFARATPFLAAIIAPYQVAASRTTGIDHVATCGTARRHNGAQRRVSGDTLSRFMSRGGLARWAFEGPVHALINPHTGAAQVAFEPLPGGIEFISTNKFDPSGAKRASEAMAWYGFGVPISDPADLVLRLRNEISDPRHAHARRVVHV
jgi:hypothetical protein